MNIVQQNAVEQQATDFYTYVLKRPAKTDTPKHLIDENGMVVFYVGKGRGKRISNHELCSRKNETCRHMPCRIIRKVWREGGQVSKEKICEDVSEQSAFKVERMMIAIGRTSQWPLCNLTDGGDTGPTGYRHTQEQVEALRHRSIKQMSDPVHRQRIGNINRGQKLPEEQVKKHAEYLRQLYASSPDMVELQRQHQQRRWSSQEEHDKYRTLTVGSIAKAAAANVGNTYNAKHYSGFLAPDGITIYKDIYNLKAFCQEHGLISSKMGQVANGQRQSHQGWTAYPPIERESTTFYTGSGFISPNGEIFEGHTIPNLAEFCRIHELGRTGMVSVNTGNLQSHKGWTRYPPIEKTPVYYSTSFRSPCGEIFTNITSLNAFCREHGLQASNMSLVAQGKQPSHKGWTKYIP